MTYNLELDVEKSVKDIVKAPAGPDGASAVLYAAMANGVFRSDNGGLTWTEPGLFTGDNITTIAVHPDSAGLLNDVIYAGTEDAGVWVSEDSGSTWNAYTGGMGEGLRATTPVVDTNNTGNGVMSAVDVGANTLSEYWTVTCTAEVGDGGTFSVTGTVSGAQASATVGALYTSDSSEVSFTISDGSTDFAVGDSFTFSSTRDPGRKIKDLLVDKGNNRLYAITYFWGPLESHATGNVYVHALFADGSMDPVAPGAWSEANTGLAQFEPPDDTTLFTQHVMAPDIPGSPTALYIGGEGINFYKATSDLTTGALSWQVSKSGLTNLIMARMPILFSGICSMDVITERYGDTVSYTVYIEDTNGNPPISGSIFTIKTYDADDELIATILNITYPDTYTYQGTFRDIADSSTDNPYTVIVVVDPSSSVTKVEFTFTPTCEDTVPGCSGGSEQTETYTY